MSTRSVGGRLVSIPRGLVRSLAGQLALLACVTVAPVVVMICVPMLGILIALSVSTTRVSKLPRTSGAESGCACTCGSPGTNGFGITTYTPR